MLEIQENTRVFVCPTDTIYGISARFNDAEAKERIEKLKNRGETHRFITLIADQKDLGQFGIELTDRQESFLKSIWPGSVTVILPDGKGSDMAFRVPDYPELQELIKKIGPIVSTSANVHGRNPAKTAKEAEAIFGDDIDEYIDVGELSGESSTIIKILR